MKKRVLSMAMVLLMAVCLIPGASCAASGQDHKPGQDKYNHIDVRIAGTMTVDSRINGKSQEGYPQTINVTVSNVTASREGANVGTFKKKSGNGKENEWRCNLNDLSLDDIILLKCTLTGTLNGTSHSWNFSKTYSGSGLTDAVNNCPGKNGFDFDIEDKDLTESFTADMGFFTAEGGTLLQDSKEVSQILYSDQLVGSDFPDIPKTSAEKYYEFAGWYPCDADGSNVSKTAVDTFPGKVTESAYYMAVWKKTGTAPEIIEPVAAAYKVEHYLQQADGSYTLKESLFPLVGKIGTEVNASVKTFEGYHYNAAISNAKGVVTKPVIKDNTESEEDMFPQILTLKLYYDKDTVPTPTPDPKPTPAAKIQQTANTNVPQTGDSFHMIPLAILLLVSAAGITAIIIKRRRSQHAK